MSKRMVMSLPPATEVVQSVKGLLKVQRVNFVSFVYINYQPVNQINNDKFDIHLAGDLLYYTEKSSGIKYISPLSNIASAVIDHE